MQKIILTGPESSGKTTVAEKLADHFQTDWVPEFARSYLSARNGFYEQKDLLEIAKGQFFLEERATKNSLQKKAPLLICDTSFLVLKIWSIYKYGTCPTFIQKQLENQQNALFILCGTDIRWEFDPLREHPNNREELYEIYKKELLDLNFKFIEISGNEETRLNQCITKINNVSLL